MEEGTKQKDIFIYLALSKSWRHYKKEFNKQPEKKEFENPKPTSENIDTMYLFFSPTAV